MSEEIPFKKISRIDGQMRTKDTNVVRITRTGITVGYEATRKLLGSAKVMPDKVQIAIEYNVEHKAVRFTLSSSRTDAYTLTRFSKSAYSGSIPAALRVSGMPYGIYLPYGDSLGVFKLDTTFSGQDKRHSSNKAKFK